MDFLLTLDQALLRFINQGLRNPAFDWLMPRLSDWDYVWIPLLPVVLYVAVKGSAQSRWLIFSLALVFAAGDILTTQVLKPFFFRPRPYAEMSGIMVCRAGVWAPVENVVFVTTMSLPSAHAVNTAAAGMILSRSRPRWRPVIFLLVFLVCFSRVYTGVHYPGDTLAGVLFGLGLAGLFLEGQKTLLKLFPDRFAWLREEAI